MNEIWKPIKGYKGLYEISSLGLIRSLKTGKKIRTCIDGVGYRRCNLYKKGKPKSHTLHRLLAIAFIKNYNERRNQVNHINGIKDDNRIENLEWVTVGENNLHAYATGLKKQSKKSINVGETHGMSKLNGKQVLEIYKLCNKGFLHREIAKKFGISRAHVTRIANGNAWEKITNHITLL